MQIVNHSCTAIDHIETWTERIHERLAGRVHNGKNVLDIESGLLADYVPVLGGGDSVGDGGDSVDDGGGDPVGDGGVLDLNTLK